MDNLLNIAETELITMARRCLKFGLYQSSRFKFSNLYGI